MATTNSNAKSQQLMERRIAEGLRHRRAQLGLSTAGLAARSDVSRAMISKIERLEASPTAALLGRLCNGLGITLSSLIASAETVPGLPIARGNEQPVWRDPDTGLRRTMVSPRNTGSRTELVHIELPPGAEVRYDAQHHTAYDQHLWVLHGRLTLTIGSEAIELAAGDCIRSRVDVPNVLSNRGRTVCRYLVVIAR